MNPTMTSIEVILLQDLAKRAAPRPEDDEALRRLERKGYSARTARDWLITEAGRRALACWQDDCIRAPAPPATPDAIRRGGDSPRGGLWPTVPGAGPQIRRQDDGSMLRRR